MIMKILRMMDSGDPRQGRFHESNHNSQLTVSRREVFYPFSDFLTVLYGDRNNASMRWFGQYSN